MSDLAEAKLTAIFLALEEYKKNTPDYLLSTGKLITNLKKVIGNDFISDNTINIYPQSEAREKSFGISYRITFVDGKKLDTFDFFNFKEVPSDEEKITIATLKSLYSSLVTLSNLKNQTIFPVVVHLPNWILFQALTTGKPQLTDRERNILTAITDLMKEMPHQVFFVYRPTETSSDLQELSSFLRN